MELQAETSAVATPARTRSGRRRVVVGADQSSGARAALEFAFAEAARRHAELDVVVAYPADLPWAWDESLDAPDLEAVRSTVSTRADEVRATAPGGFPEEDLSVRVEVGRGSAADVLIDASEGAELLVVGSRGRGAVRSALLGSVALRCVTAARCPVVVVHDREATPADDGPPRVVVGVDGSPSSKAALAEGLRAAAGLDAVVEAVGSYCLADHWMRPSAIPSVAVDQIRAEVRDRVRAAVDETVASLHGERLPDIRPVVLDGQAADVLLQRSAGARLLVVGSRGHRPLSGLLLGSVALNCVVHGTSPVMVVPAQPA